MYIRFTSEYCSSCISQLASGNNNLNQIFQVWGRNLLTWPALLSEKVTLAFIKTLFIHFTLYVIDMHQNRSISLFPTPFGHFHFHPFPGLIWMVDLRPCHMQQARSRPDCWIVFQIIQFEPRSVYLMASMHEPVLIYADQLVCAVFLINSQNSTEKKPKTPE